MKKLTTLERIYIALHKDSIYKWGRSVKDDCGNCRLRITDNAKLCRKISKVLNLSNKGVTECYLNGKDTSFLRAIKNFEL